MQNTAYKQTRAYTTVHKKLMAAIAMLLIASILLATTTYAWYVLSTAPEVTGITTTVGSNGALEMALADSTTWDNPDGTVSSSTGDSMAVSKVTDSNITWGNLVDLSDSSYGLTGLELNLATVNSGATDVSELLSYPLYGADGRIASLSSDLTLASYNSSSSTFSDSAYGVRAYGASATALSLADRLAKTQSKASTYASSARSNVLNSITNNKDGFYAFLMAYSLVSDKSTAIGTNAQTYYNTWDSMVTRLEKAVDQMETSLTYMYLAYYMTDETTYDTYYSAASALSLDELVTYMTAGAAEGATGPNITVNASLTSAYNAYVTWAKEVASARESLNTILTLHGSDITQVTYAEMKTYAWDVLMTKENSWFIVNTTQKLTTSSTTVLKATSTDEVPVYTYWVVLSSAGLSYVSSGASDTLILDSNSGVFYDVTSLIGNFSVSYDYSGMTVYLTTESKTTTDTSLLTNAVSAVSSLTATESTSASTSTELSDFYGYVLDFYFRTNAEGTSTLALQTDAADRVDGDDDTEGSGSYIEFSSEVPEALLNAITIAFYDGSTMDETDLTAPTLLATATINSEPISGYKYSLSCDKITTLSQNTASKISVVVYIDGTKVDNTGALSDGTVSFDLNLQFCVDADLVPMSYNNYQSITTKSSDTGSGSSDDSGDTGSGTDDSGNTEGE